MDILAEWCGWTQIHALGHAHFPHVFRFSQLKLADHTPSCSGLDSFTSYIARTTIIPSRFMLNDSSPNLEHTYTRVGLQLQRAHWKTDHWTGEHQLWIASDAVTAEQGMEVLEQMPSDYWLSRILEWESKDLGSLWIILFLINLYYYKLLVSTVVQRWRLKPIVCLYISVGCYFIDRP